MHQSILCRSLLALWLAVTLHGCAAWKPPHESFARLQDPLPGQAFLYLVRAPHDDARLLVHLNQKAVAELPENTYTALSLSPGTYLLTCTGRGMNGNDQVVAEPFEVSLHADERKILLMSGALERKSEKVFLLGQTRVARGTRAWQQVGDTDASSLIPVLRLVQANGV